jgi:hypothetical protein
MCECAGRIASCQRQGVGWWQGCRGANTVPCRPPTPHPPTPTTPPHRPSRVPPQPTCNGTDSALCSSPTSDQPRAAWARSQPASPASGTSSSGSQRWALTAMLLNSGCRVVARSASTRPPALRRGQQGVHACGRHKQLTMQQAVPMCFLVLPRAEPREEKREGRRRRSGLQGWARLGPRFSAPAALLPHFNCPPLTHVHA